MTRLQKLQLRQSERKQALGALLDTPADDRSDAYEADIAAATAELRALEGEFQAAMVAGEDEPAEEVTTDTPEGREMRELVNRANVGEIFDAALERRSIDGATRDLQEHYKLQPNQVPLDLLETRAITPAPADVGANQQAIIPYVFPSSVSAFLGIPQPRVPVGEAVYTVLTSTLDVGTPAESAEQDETTGAFSAEVLSPGRIQASFFYSREDSARFMGMDSALRANLSEGLQDGLDEAVISGTNGLLTGTNLANNNQSAETTYALYRSQFAFGRVDGRYAGETGDVRVVMGADTYAHAAGQYRGNNDNQDALQSLREATGGVRVSAHVPDTAANKQNNIIRLGMRMDAVAAVWEGITLIPDPVTGAKKGEITLTAVMLHAVKVLRAGGFYKQQAAHA